MTQFIHSKMGVVRTLFHFMIKAVITYDVYKAVTEMDSITYGLHLYTGKEVGSIMLHELIAQISCH